ncbi:hypothetical protein C8R43DRAFT_840355, partial [Mycena crocata]
YWSLDRFGHERLSEDEAQRLGFPAIQLKTMLLGRFWDASTYFGVHQFHAGKGFDPQSQEVARHLGYPLLDIGGE